ncbi:hypothetical protein [Phenylobacterium sp.]|uniref:hypothetical protein n=1 Tax=Phenylobacterium sp. TaxID=1871053 RepID=UPI002DE2C041|nr:hypothetical protein [Phenylobacterium sp.]
MSKLDLAAAWLLVILGAIHNLVVAPMSFHGLDGRALWFVTGGISLWFGGAINLIWLTNRDRPRIRFTALAADLVLLAFVVAYAVVMHQLTKPAGLLLIFVVAWLTGRALTARAPATERRDRAA